jgi:hypothetical protein
MVMRDLNLASAAGVQNHLATKMLATEDGQANVMCATYITLIADENRTPIFAVILDGGVPMGTRDVDRTQQIIRDLTNPVEAIVNLLYLIRHDHRDSESVLKYLQMADSQVNCLIEIVQRHPSLAA